MELTILLSKVFGIYLLVGGLAIWFRRAYFAPIIGAFAHEPLTRLVTGSIELVAGLFLIFTHNIWLSAPASLVSLIGWLFALEGAMYLLMSDRMAEKMMSKFNHPAWFTFGGIGALILGLYLISFGFGWLS